MSLIEPQTFETVFGPDLESIDNFAYTQFCVKCHESLNNTKRIIFNHENGHRVRAMLFPQWIAYSCHKRLCAYENSIDRLIINRI